MSGPRPPARPVSHDEAITEVLQTYADCVGHVEAYNTMAKECLTRSTSTDGERFSVGAFVCTSIKSAVDELERFVDEDVPEQHKDEKNITASASIGPQHTASSMASHEALSKHISSIKYWSNRYGDELYTRFKDRVTIAEKRIDVIQWIVARDFTRTLADKRLSVDEVSKRLNGVELLRLTGEMCTLLSQRAKDTSSDMKDCPPPSKQDAAFWAKLGDKGEDMKSAASGIWSHFHPGKHASLAITQSRWEKAQSDLQETLKPVSELQTKAIAKLCVQGWQGEDTVVSLKATGGDDDARSDHSVATSEPLPLIVNSPDSLGPL